MVFGLFQIFGIFRLKFEFKTTGKIKFIAVSFTNKASSEPWMAIQVSMKEP
jgi:hypothetical protein